MNTESKKQMKDKFLTWVKNHPDVWHKDKHNTSHFWWVQNCLGDILGWPEYFNGLVKEAKKLERKK